MPVHEGMHCVRSLTSRNTEMTERRFDIDSVFGIFQDIGETARLLLQSFAGGSASDQLGLCTVEGKTPYRLVGKRPYRLQNSMALSAIASSRARTRLALGLLNSSITLR